MQVSCIYLKKIELVIIKINFLYRFQIYQENAYNIIYYSSKGKANASILFDTSFAGVTGNSIAIRDILPIIIIYLFNKRNLR